MLSLRDTTAPSRHHVLLHDMALIYLTLAHRTDGDLSLQEIDAITRKLHTWMPESDENEVLNLVQDAMATYEHEGTHVFEKSIDAVREGLPPALRTTLLNDLRDVAGADGAVSDAEHAMIDRLQHDWDVA